MTKNRYGLEIKAATGAEASGVAELLASVGTIIAAPVLAERLDALRLGPGAALIAVEWGPPSGLIVWSWVRTLDVGQPTAFVSLLVVGPEQRRRGIGRLLIKAAAQAARLAGCDTLSVLAAPGQQDLQAFCRSTGFADAGPRFERALRKKA